MRLVSSLSSLAFLRDSIYLLGVGNECGGVVNDSYRCLFWVVLSARLARLASGAAVGS